MQIQTRFNDISDLSQEITSILNSFVTQQSSPLLSVDNAYDAVRLNVSLDDLHTQVEGLSHLERSSALRSLNKDDDGIDETVDSLTENMNVSRLLETLMGKLLPHAQKFENRVFNDFSRSM